MTTETHIKSQNTASTFVYLLISVTDFMATHQKDSLDHGDGPSDCPSRSYVASLAKNQRCGQLMRGLEDDGIQSHHVSYKSLSL